MPTSVSVQSGKQNLFKECKTGYLIQRFGYTAMEELESHPETGRNSVISHSSREAATPHPQPTPQAEGHSDWVMSLEPGSQSHQGTPEPWWASQQGVWPQAAGAAQGRAHEERRSFSPLLVDS